MNLSQKQSILNLIESILDFNFDQFIIDSSSSGNIDDIKFGDYTVTDFKTTYLKVFKQLKAELESGLGIMLPNQETFHNEFASVTLDSEISNFNSYFQNLIYKDNAAEILKRFVYYEIRQGFWNKSAVKSHSIDVEKLSEAQANLVLVQENLSKNIDIFKDLKSKFDKQIEAFELILTEKETQSVNITELLKKAKEEDEEIDDLLVSSKATNVEIVALSSTIKAQSIIIDTNIAAYEESFAKIEKDNKELVDGLMKSQGEVNAQLEEAKTGNNFIQSQQDEINRLVGLAADGTLGYKFDSRKVELERGVNVFWRWAVPGSIILALGWVVVVFTLLKADLGNHWIELLVNLIKTSPAWLLVGFVFSQYGKERNLQEEYAFKSAIAMTLTSYSQMLAADDASPTKNRSSKQEMLLKSIENLYTQPILKVEKQENGDFVNSKQFLESLKSITDMIKNVKS